MSRDIILFGSGGLAKELLGYLDTDARYNVLGCVSSEDFNNPLFASIPVWREWPSQFVQLPNVGAILAVSDPALRRTLVAHHFGVDWISYVHPSAHLSPYVRVGRGLVMTPQSMICGDAICGEFLFMNTNATIGHDAAVGDFVSMMPNSEVCGGCFIGNDVLLGIGATVLPGKSVGQYSKASAGAIVRSDVLMGRTVYGDPARERSVK